MSRKTNVMELLRRANPVPPSEREKLADRLEGVVGSRTPDLPAMQVSGSPLRRIHRNAVRVAVAIAVIIGAVLLVAPALGLRVPVVAFWQAEHASDRVERQFESLSLGTPSGMDPGAIQDEARRVGAFVLSDGPHTLWVAPTGEGGFCLLLTGLGGGCARLGTEPLGVTWVMPSGTAVRKKNSLALGRTASVVAGHLNSDYAASVEVRFANGSVVRPTIVWVSEPIAAGFFAYELSEGDRRAGEVSAVVALDGAGNVVAEDRGRPPESRGVPTEAIQEEKRIAVRVATRRGVASVVIAPTRYEGRCAWLEFLDRSLRFVPCMPKGYSFGPFAMRFVPTSDQVLLVGAVADDVERVELRFAGGEFAEVHPKGGFVLFEIPITHLQRGKEAVALIGRSRRGDVLHAAMVDALGGGRFACLAPLPVRASRRGAFCP
jgi:hypothetical protein